MMMLDNYIELRDNYLGFKCLHNEIKVMVYLKRFGPSLSLSIQLYLNRSVSAHNTDLKRLKSLGFIDFNVNEKDRRERLYFLTDQGGNTLKNFVDFIREEVIK